ncbi:MAG: biotin-dependent carboxyltransferase family protein [Pseudomonadota bacterium]
MRALRIIEPGLQTTVQDLGRTGAQRFGVPVSGVRDREAMALANALVGAPVDQAVLELGYIGPSFEVEAEAVTLAVVGARMQIALTRGDLQEMVPDGRSFQVNRGDLVTCGPLRDAPSACLAVAGGFDLAPVMGSRSTFLKAAFGGFRGRALAAGDLLPMGEASPAPQTLTLTAPFPPEPADRIRVVMGPQEDYFTSEVVEIFLSAKWQVTQEADRMGLRLAGPELAHNKGYNITSDAIVTGSIQVPGNGLPIVLLVDRQTSGGYPKIATVITADLPKLGRLGPGERFGFQAVTAAEGAAIARCRATALAADIAAIKRWAPEGEVDLDALYGTELISPPIYE